MGSLSLSLVPWPERLGKLLPTNSTLFGGPEHATGVVRQSGIELGPFARTILSLPSVYLPVPYC